MRVNPFNNNNISFKEKLNPAALAKKISNPIVRDAFIKFSEDNDLYTFRKIVHTLDKDQAIPDLNLIKESTNSTGIRQAVSMILKKWIN